MTLFLSWNLFFFLFSLTISNFRQGYRIKSLNPKTRSNTLSMLNSYCSSSYLTILCLYAHWTRLVETRSLLVWCRLRRRTRRKALVVFFTGRLGSVGILSSKGVILQVRTILRDDNAIIRISQAMSANKFIPCRNMTPNQACCRRTSMLLVSSEPISTCTRFKELATSLNTWVHPSLLALQSNALAEKAYSWIATAQSEGVRNTRNGIHAAECSRIIGLLTSDERRCVFY